MDDLIYRQDALNAMDCKFTVTGVDNANVVMGVINLIGERIRMLPSAQSDRGIGEWILVDEQCEEDVQNGNYRYICSCCGSSDLHAKTQEVPYCWHCGSRMRGKHEYTTGRTNENHGNELSLSEEKMSWDI